MELIDSKAKIVMPHNNGNLLDGIYADIARAARVCYASTKTTDNEDLVKDLIKKGHGRPLEFGTVYLKTTEKGLYNRYEKNPYSRIYVYSPEDGDKTYFITTNYRVLVQNEWLDDLKYICAPVRGAHHERVTIQWTISRATADSFRTHVSISSLMQSTRYCNYSKDKFGNELTMIRPYWIDAPLGHYDISFLTSVDFAKLSAHSREYIRHMLNTECRYNLFADTMKFPAEAARSILPLDIKTEFIQCAYVDDWKRFFEERAHDSTGKAQPDAAKITREIEEEFKELTQGNTKTMAKDKVPEGFVDLGLSVYWAKCNLGAEKEEDYGKYYAWGDATGYAADEVSGKFGPTWYDGLPALQISTDLSGANDAATAALGNGYRMPTKAEFEELLTLDYEPATVGDIAGMKFTGNGNSIFIPFAGSAYGDSVRSQGYGAGSWSSSYEGTSLVWGLGCYINGDAGVYDDYRCYGFSIRPVCQK